MVFTRAVRLGQTSQEQFFRRSETTIVTITDDLIESGKSAVGGYSKAQLALLGVAWHPSVNGSSRSPEHR